MASSIDELREDLHEASEPVYLADKASIIDYYKDTYGNEWKSHIVGDLEEITGLKHNTLMRRFQGGREYSKMSSKAKEEYEQLGEELPPDHYDPPEGGFRVEFAGWVQISDEVEYRVFSETVGGSEAYELANNPSFGACMSAYFPPGLVSMDGGEWELNITPL
jgi:hypothetical protein